MATSSTWDFVQSSKLKDLDLLKKGTEIFDVKTAISSQAKSISENFKLLKKDVSESCKGKHFVYAFLSCEEDC